MRALHKVCVITGTRAEYGLLRPVMQGVKDDPSFTLQIIATGAHLSSEFGLTYREIEGDGFVIDSKVEILTKSDTDSGVINAMARGLLGFSNAIKELTPDLIVVLGDRYEVFVAAQVAMIMQIPLVHLGGGDVGSGTYDNTIRHCITKMASLHFVTHEAAFRRVLQLGERPDRVFCFGATCVENIFKTALLSKESLENDLGINFEGAIFLVTFHPLTMSNASAEAQLQMLLDVFDLLRAESKLTIIFTKANADNGGRALNRMLETYVKENPGCFLFASLGQKRYLSMLKHATVVLGNSSSGIYEAPYLQTPTVDIGSRQRGRAAPASVFRCEADKNSIKNAIVEARAFDFDGMNLIYGDGNTSANILKKIKEIIDLPDLYIKEFVDIVE